MQDDNLLFSGARSALPPGPGLVTGRTRLAGLFAAVLGLLFGFLYVVLSLESYSLLAGAVALFGVLSLVMAVTRRVDWSGTAGDAPVPAAQV